MWEWLGERERKEIDSRCILWNCFLRDFCHLSKFSHLYLVPSVIHALTKLLSGEISMYLITNKRGSFLEESLRIWLLTRGFIALQHLSFFSYFHCTFAWLSMFLFICDKARLNIKISKFLLMLNFFTFMYENLNFYIFQIIHSMYPCFLEANNTVTCVDIKL